MPAILESFEFRKGVGQQENAATYDWDTFLDGQMRRFTAGEDYTCKTNTFSTLARASAKRKGLKIKTTKVSDPEGIVIQAVPGDSPEADPEPTPAPAPAPAPAAAPAPKAGPAPKAKGGKK